MCIRDRHIVADCQDSVDDRRVALPVAVEKEHPVIGAVGGGLQLQQHGAVVLHRGTAVLKEEGELVAGVSQQQDPPLRDAEGDAARGMAPARQHLDRHVPQVEACLLYTSRCV